MQSAEGLTILHGSSTYQANLFQSLYYQAQSSTFLWCIRGTLHNYVPRHANRETQSYQLPSETTTSFLARDELEVGVVVSGQEESSACRGEELNNIPSLVSAGSSSVNCMQMEETNDKNPFWNPNSVPKRKRSELTQRILSPVERLQRQLYNNLQEPEFENIPDGGEDVTLIYARNKYIPPNEIGLGAMLLLLLLQNARRLYLQWQKITPFAQ
ncbi:hypothetical protein RDI58_003147 [Solanum bulbocastanum]|uniref:Uncharacterized protein n=1 Tax=Solanum bulbocastanum TaxID=147425 RepID=A0AAN8UH42_SOLBU